MDNLQKSELNSSTLHQLKLLFVLKEELDLVYKQLDKFRGACRSVDRFNRVMKRMLQDDHSANTTSNGQLDPARMVTEFVKFERNYRVSRKKLRKLDRKMYNVNLYDKLHDLYQSFVVGESVKVEDSIDSFGIEPPVVDEVSCSRPVEIEDTQVDDFAGIKIDTNFENCMEIQLDPRQLQTSNLATSFDSSSFPMVDVGGSAPVSSQEFNQSNQYGNSFRMASDLSHQSDESEPRYRCNWEGCHYSTNRSANLKTHQTIHIGIRPFQCSQCGKSFKLLSHLSYHKKTHQSESRYKCRVEGCDFRTNRSDILKNHLTVHTASAERPFQCSWEGCNYSTNRNANLKTHQAVHTGERPFQCSQCNKSFKFPSHLSHHKRTHESEPRFKCNIDGCDFTTNRTDTLKTHEIIHTGKRPFQCPWEGCDYSTIRSANLKVHLNIHTGERPYQCDQCDKSFKSSSTLSIHKRTHETEPRYRCNWEGCDYSTIYSSSFQSHQTVHARYLPSGIYS